MKTLQNATAEELGDAILAHHAFRAISRLVGDDETLDHGALRDKVQDALRLGGTFRFLPNDPLLRASIALGFEIGCETIRRLNDQLVLVDAPNIWRCFHCGSVFDNEQEAAEHFGRLEDFDPPSCISTKHPLVVKLRARIEYLEQKLDKIADVSAGEA